jgi:hypothetical protein
MIVRRNRRGEPNHFVYPLSRKKHPATQRRMVTISAKIEDEDDDEGRERLGSGPLALSQVAEVEDLTYVNGKNSAEIETKTDS